MSDPEIEASAAHGRCVRIFVSYRRMEVALPSSPFRAEWEALQRNGYRPFTKIERSVPRVFVGLYGTAVVVMGVLLIAALSSKLI